ncbi:MAG TPA: 50S ribosomal protein L22 [Candidatus Cloacimonadota bacterium]|mgnify:CR=1 FL=1|nr:50S ribosomal protein L22 [Candidatus Cloacimonadota bacterium]HPT71655.1 50S ribosomal protein L22 [Candidatus Cloacimonadota bacterium]
MEAKAILKHSRGSARKARLVLDNIRGKNVEDAKHILRFTTKRAAGSIGKLLNSAFANATFKNPKITEKEMIVDKAFADEGPIMKRYMPRAQGRAYLIRRRTCHITLELKEKE